MPETRYTPELADVILDRMSNGMALRQVCRDEGMPAESSVRQWVRDDRDGFAVKYNQARAMQIDCWADEILAVAYRSDLDPGDTAKIVEDGISRIQAGGGTDIVLVDPQYSPQVTQRAESAGKMVKLLGKVAELRHVGIFPRFEVMRDWHEKQALPVESFVIADGLHMNDWGYACFAQLLGDDIIRSVGQIKLGVNVPADVRTYRPM